MCSTVSTYVSGGRVRSAAERMLTVQTPPMYCEERSVIPPCRRREPLSCGPVVSCSWSPASSARISAATTAVVNFACGNRCSIHTQLEQSELLGTLRDRNSEKRRHAGDRGYSSCQEMRPAMEIAGVGWSCKANRVSGSFTTPNVSGVRVLHPR